MKLPHTILKGDSKLCPRIVQLNKEIIKGQLKELVRGSVEETLNKLLEKEAESLTQATRYERSEARQGYRSGHYDRNLTTTSGDARSICRGSRVCPAKLPSSSGIAAGRAAWRKPSSRCIWWVFPDAKYQRCTVHFYRNVFSVVPKSKVKIVAKMLKAIHA